MAPLRDQGAIPIRRNSRSFWIWMAYTRCLPPVRQQDKLVFLRDERGLISRGLKKSQHQTLENKQNGPDAGRAASTWCLKIALY